MMNSLLIQTFLAMGNGEIRNICSNLRINVDHKYLRLYSKFLSVD